MHGPTNVRVVIDVGIAMKEVMLIKYIRMKSVFKILKVSELSDSEWTEKLDQVLTLLVSLCYNVHVGRSFISQTCFFIYLFIYFL
jgi:hypothetical protein